MDSQNEIAIAKGIRSKIEEFYSKIDVLKAALEVITGHDESIFQAPTIKKIANAPIVNKKSLNTEPPFKVWLKENLSDGVPKTSRTLLTLYNDETGRNMSISTFSSKLGEQKKKGLIGSHDFEERPIGIRTYYGLSDWFDGKSLKEMYKERCI